MLEVGVVDVCINSEQPLEYHFDDVEEILWERDAKSTREDLFIIELILNPSHQKVDILLSAHFQWCLDIMAISP